MKSFPDSIGDLENLTELTIDNGNSYVMSAKVPESIGNLRKLKVLNLANAQVGVTDLPISLGKLDQLETLDLTGNQYSVLPKSVSSISNLNNLNLNFNSLVDLPSSLEKTNIEFISLRNNCKITNSVKKQKELRRRFPKVRFDFSNELDCP